MTHVDISTIEYAIRYCITRESYAFDDGIRLASKWWADLSDATRSDVREACKARGVAGPTLPRKV